MRLTDQRKITKIRTTASSRKAGSILTKLKTNSKGVNHEYARRNNFGRI